MPNSITDSPSTRPTSLPSSTKLERAVQQQGVVQRGNEGAPVREAQALLKAHGHDLGIDGDFGPKTKAAVVAFQRSRGIDADGLIGPDTLRELRTPTAGVDHRTGRDTGITARPEDRVPGMTGADFQRRAEADAARRNREAPVSTDAARSGNTPVTLAPAGASPQEKFNHYRNIVLQNGGEDPLTSSKPVVLGVRGIDRDGRAHETRNGRFYDDTFVVLNRNGTATELKGSTHAGQVTSGLVSAVGMIRSGNFDVKPNGVRSKDNGMASWHVLTKSGSGNIPGIRDRNADGRFQAGEIARRDNMTEILFHPGTADSPRSIGCQTLPPAEYRRFLRAIGSQGFTYTLVDANGRT
ncbi:MAG: peptidoglycan-binding protein [Deltaproteobacteria bacterium]|nr:peptidoglycan-binding protein [Deltaproteobacteria bacterium]